ncbi:MAG TPA: SCO family protein [Acidimicrobiales bacterium]|nr:SCO family protein [Acidimicrobiales bacterium]
MGRSLQTGNSLIVSSFHTALFHQFIAVFVLGALCAIGFNVFRTVQYRKLKAHGMASFPTSRSEPLPEPAARRILRIGFGALWIFDGLLQIQSSMPLGLPSGVIQPSASGSPVWVQHLVNTGVTIWSNHPIQAASATVWIQVGIGLWLLVAPRGRWSRFGGLASVGWGLLVWSFGEAFGGLFSPGATWLFGLPGAVLFYCVAGVLIALPERAYATARLGRVVLALSGLFLVGMAALQAWPGRGFWQGHGGTLVGMVRAMAHTQQPGFLSSWVSSFASLVAAHGWAVNLFVVLALATIGGLLLSGRPGLSLVGLVALVSLCLADWVLVEDLGFFGGLGTDPNSMLPMALIVVAGYVAMVRLPVAMELPQAAAEAPASADERAAATEPTGWWERASLSYAVRTAAAAAALAIVLVGAAPMATAAVNGNADPILSEALNGNPNALQLPAPHFTLTDQHGQTVSLASLRGHAVALTFLDPVCTSDCPLIAQEFRQADLQLGAAARNVDFVAIVANPIYRSISFTKAFDSQESMNRLPNWYFLTGSVNQLQRVWNSYGVLVSTVGAGGMVAHSDLAFIIDGRGRERDALIDDPGPTQAFASSFSSLLLSRINDTLHS